MISVRELSQQDLLNIKARLDMGHQVQEIARDYNINLGRISEIKTGKRPIRTKPTGQGVLEL